MWRSISSRGPRSASSRRSTTSGGFPGAVWRRRRASSTAASYWSCNGFDMWRLAQSVLNGGPAAFSDDGYSAAHSCDADSGVPGEFDEPCCSEFPASLPIAGAGEFRGVRGLLIGEAVRVDRETLEQFHLLCARAGGDLDCALVGGFVVVGAGAWWVCHASFRNAVWLGRRVQQGGNEPSHGLPITRRPSLWGCRRSRCTSRTAPIRSRRGSAPSGPSNAGRDPTTSPSAKSTGPGASSTRRTRNPVPRHFRSTCTCATEAWARQVFRPRRTPALGCGDGTGSCSLALLRLSFRGRPP